MDYSSSSGSSGSSSCQDNTTNVMEAPRYQQLVGALAARQLFSVRGNSKNMDYRAAALWTEAYVARKSTEKSPEVYLRYRGCAAAPKVIARSSRDHPQVFAPYPPTSSSERAHSSPTTLSLTANTVYSPTSPRCGLGVAMKGHFRAKRRDCAGCRLQGSCALRAKKIRLKTRWTQSGI